MNSCVLMAEIVTEPQLRHTQDQAQVCEMGVEFPGARAEDPPQKLKVVGWGNLAQEMHERHHQGDRVVVEGRLSMNTITLQDGSKKKVAELIAQRIHNLGTAIAAPTTTVPATVTTPAATPAAKPTSTRSPQNQPTASPKATAKPAAPQVAEPVAATTDEADLDIPF